MKLDMKKFFVGAIIGFGFFMMMSYKTSNNASLYAGNEKVYSIPLMQKNVIVTSQKTYVKELIKKGFIVQDVDVLMDPYYKTRYHYTLIKY